MKFDLSVVGLGKLGATMLACFASKGFNSIGYDKNLKISKTINEGKAPNDETNLNRLIRHNRKKLYATYNLSNIVQKTNKTFIVVPTPTAKNGTYDLKILKSCLKEIAKELKKKKSYHLIILCSTVMPEDSEKYLIPLIEKFSEKKFGSEFGFIYSPEFISLGNIINEYLNPQLILIGSKNNRDKILIKKIYKKMYSAKLFKFMNIKDAELTKISINSFMTMKISFSNMIGLFCLKMQDSNSENILITVKKFFEKFTKGYKTGLGYGGPCLPRDNIALASLNKKFGYNLNLPKSVDQINNSISKNLYNHFLKKYKNKKILFLGISYKPKTSYYEKSQSLDIIKKTANRNNVSIFDFNPITINFNRNILIETNIKKAVKKNEIIVLCHYDNRYVKLNLKNKIVIDFWKQLKIKPKNYLSF